METYDVCGTMVKTDADVYDEHPGGYVLTSRAIERFRAYEQQWLSGLNREQALYEENKKTVDRWATLCGVLSIVSFFAGFALASIFASV